VGRRALASVRCFLATDPADLARLPRDIRIFHGVLLSLHRTKK
jgi:hypothetical protein